jgi:hypothetical protein
MVFGIGVNYVLGQFEIFNAINLLDIDTTNTYIDTKNHIVWCPYLKKVKVTL